MGEVRATAAEVCGRLDFAEVAEASGVRFRHERGAVGQKHLPETMGSGVAWLDYDGDGWWDLYAVQSGPFPPREGERTPDRLFRNLGDGTFADVSSASGTGRRHYGQGVAAADADGDGDTDLYLTNYGPDVLLANRADGSFAEASAAAGLGAGAWSSSAAFADADADGDLDLYVTRYLEYDPGHDLFCGDAETGERRYCDPSLFRGSGDLFYRNAGDGVFVEATAEAGLDGADGRGLGVVFTDLDGDLVPDLYVANDLDLNLLFRNRGDATFEDLSLVSGSAVNREGRPEAGMGVAVGDFDGDLDPDLAVTNFDVETNTLYRNLGGLNFEDVSATSGFGLPSFNLLAFGIVPLDLDADGDLDLYIATGHIFEKPKRENVTFAQRDQVLLGNGDGRFEEQRCALLDSRVTVARGLARADYDNDGDEDLAVLENGGPLALLSLESGGGDWLGVALRGAKPNSEAVGAKVTLSREGGSRARWVLAGDSYQSSSDKRVVFAVPDGGAGDLEVTWPSGGRLRLEQPVAGHYFVVFEPKPGRNAVR